MNTIENLKSDDCVYCGLQKAVDRDHVIPSCLFVKPFPPNLITVPVCRECHDDKSRDEDFIRDYLTTNLFGNQSPVANKIFHKKTLKSVQRHSSELGRISVKKGRLKPFYTSGGIYLGSIVAAPIDSTRMEKIFSRIVRGLYYDACRERIPNSYSFEVRTYYPWDFMNLWQKFNEMRLTLNQRILGNVFACGFLIAQEDPFVSMWLLSFYERVFFSVSTALI
jgi:hypothetical protein